MFQMIYAARPFGFDAGVLLDILMRARKRNSSLGVTGALLCRDDIYIQLLEGEQDAVAEIYDSILNDDRHVDIRELAARETVTRMFPGWAMRDDPVQSWMWSRDDVAKGVIRNARAEDAIALFTRLACITPQVITNDEPVRLRS